MFRFKPARVLHKLRRRPLYLGLAAVFAVALAAASSQAGEDLDSGDRRAANEAGYAVATLTPAPQPTVAIASPTATPAGGPRALLPDLETRIPLEMYIDYGSGGSRLLRFSTTVRNTGEGPMELIGELDGNGNAEAIQLVQQSDGTVETHPAGELLTSAKHRHWHLDNFALFELFPASAPDPSDGPAATQNKISFCLVDEVRIDPPSEHVAEGPQFLDCDWLHHGLSQGWSETYVADLPEQWVDITGLPDGRYVLRVTLDPDDLLLEAKNGNNAALVFIEVIGDEVSRVDGP